MPFSTQSVDRPSTQTTQAVDDEVFDIHGYSHVERKHKLKKKKYSVLLYVQEGLI